MEIRLNPALIKQLRKSKLWSQEELAVASGLGLRTIQRVEGQGIASAETAKSLAAVFEADVEELHASNNTLPYLNVQFGYVTLGAVMLILLVSTWCYRQGLLEPVAYFSLIAVLTIVATLFSTLTTQVKDDCVHWHLGLGLIRKSIPVTEIVSHKIVRNKVWWGWGLRLIPGGWLYNVSGLDAVEIKTSGDKCVRIGSDEAEAFNEAIFVMRSTE